MTQQYHFSSSNQCINSLLFFVPFSGRSRAEYTTNLCISFHITNNISVMIERGKDAKNTTTTRRRDNLACFILITSLPTRGIIKSNFQQIFHTNLRYIIYNEPNTYTQTEEKSEKMREKKKTMRRTIREQMRE